MDANKHHSSLSRPFASIRGFHYPAFGICGYSGSGKTSVILELVRQLTARGLAVGVIKHDTHGIQIDREGKDSDRLFRAGADVLIGDPTQLCLRLHRRGETSLHEAIVQMAPCYDLVLVEGHKTTPLPNKVWLSGETGDDPPPEATGITRVLRRNEDRSRILLGMIEDNLASTWQATPVYAGILFGGKSSRMGRPKHLLEINGQTWLEQTVDCVRGAVEKVVLLGAGTIPDALGDLPALPDVDAKQGPLRGMLAAMRWAPFAAWIFLPCDTPRVSSAAIRWLLQQRAPGRWAILPRTHGTDFIEPLPGCYDFRARTILGLIAPSQLADHPETHSPTIPAALSSAWENINTPEDLAITKQKGE